MTEAGNPGTYSGKIEAESFQVVGLVLILDVALEIGKQRRARFIGARLGLLQVLLGQLHARVALRAPAPYPPPASG